ncbi:MAG: hypothetical protein SF051_10455 [Elusimicrobiota bacterium]|nr:hypothetical protein [Elusimicrobiota bacterium]
MRRLAFVPLAAALLAACAGPKPCTMALCPVSADGGYEVRGVSAVSAPAGTPLPAVPSDASVEVRSGRAEFKVRASRVVAEAGTSFRFFVSSGAPALEVVSGPVSVSASSSAPAAVAPGVILLQ